MLDPGTKEENKEEKEEVDEGRSSVKATCGLSFVSSSGRWVSVTGGAHTNSAHSSI